MSTQRLSLPRITAVLQSLDIAMLPPLADAAAAAFTLDPEHRVVMTWSIGGSDGEVLCVDMVLPGQVGDAQHISTLERVNAWNQCVRWPVAVYDTTGQRVLSSISVDCDPDLTDQVLSRALALSIESNLQFVQRFGPVDAHSASGTSTHCLTAPDLQRMFDL